MIKGSKICGISDSKTLNYIINHQYPPQFIGFICNYSKSKRYVEFEKLVKLIDIKKRGEMLLKGNVCACRMKKIRSKNRYTYLGT